MNNVPTEALVPVIGVLVVLGGAGFAFINYKIGKRKLAQIDRWGRGAYGLWTGSEDSATWDRERAVSSLESWYGVTNNASFWELIKDLREGQTGNVAWDTVRALDLLRIGMAAEYVDEDKWRATTVAIAAQLQKEHTSWDALAKGFEAGMNEWQHSRGITDENELGRVQRNLPALRSQVWSSIDYDTTLVFED